MIPDWKRRALASLPWSLAAALAASLILELPDVMADDWPSRDPVQIAQAALSEAQSRLNALCAITVKG